uniref:Uncharacterized protein n=1 Tax=Vitis vinifera TaxID=29760 RepID=F6I6D5_VITVI
MEKRTTNFLNICIVLYPLLIESI